ncbi:ribosomal-processing cysteine protease Prp [Fusibacter bizertensis]
MIKVEIQRNVVHYCGVKITGHAYSDEPGRDLVCAAVSTLAQTLANAVEEVGGIPEKSLDLKISSGHFQLILKNDDLSDVIDIIFRTFRVGIEAIERTYKQYIKLKIKEVQGTC